MNSTLYCIQYKTDYISNIITEEAFEKLMSCQKLHTYHIKLCTDGRLLDPLTDPRRLHGTSCAILLRSRNSQWHLILKWDTSTSFTDKGEPRASKATEAAKRVSCMSNESLTQWDDQRCPANTGESTLKMSKWWTNGELGGEITFWSERESRVARWLISDTGGEG